jgi:hypothetical protein
MHGMWVLWDGYCMVHMLLSEHTNVAKRGRFWLGADR